jgi:2-O-methyltransferase
VTFSLSQGPMAMRIRKILSRFPRLKVVVKRVYYFLRSEPILVYEEFTAEKLRSLLHRPDPVVLEIGCNDGTNTAWFLEKFPSPRVYCFEPDPRARERFRERMGDRSEVHLFPCAIGDRNGETSFHMSGGRETREMPGGWDFSGSIRKPKDHLVRFPGITFDQTITVPVRTLDSWCAEHGIDEIDFLWMDVQGAEMDVVQGGQVALRRTRFVLTEYSTVELYEGQARLRKLLRALTDFQVMARYPGDLLLKNRRF